MTQPLVIVVLAVLGLLVLVVGWVAVGTARALRETRTEVADLRARLARAEAQQRPSEPRPEAAPVLITGWGTEDDALVADRAAPVDGRLFADTVLRETVVKAAGLGHGVRRALAPEVRDRIRLEMRREVRRARKQRRSDLKAARRAWQADARRRMAAAGGEAGAAEDDAA